MQTHVEIQRGALDHASLLDRSATQGFSAPDQHKKAGFTATRLQVASVVFGLFFALTGGMVHAQGASGTDAAAPLTREQAKMERVNSFARTNGMRPRVHGSR